MSASETVAEQKFLYNKTSVGFWLYLMTDCVLFASLFAMFAVLRNATAAGPSGTEIFSMPLVLAETIILLTSSFSCGIALVNLKLGNIRTMLVALGATYVLGVAFLTIEITEFAKLISEGHGPQQSAFLSAFFTLVGTHGLHITVGLIWLLVLVCVLARRGLSDKWSRQMTLFAMFWHFLDLVWIFIFTVVYLIGVVK
jgi:cytochrome o ubiquinol oxidase subunit 3